MGEKGQSINTAAVSNVATNTVASMPGSGAALASAIGGAARSGGGSPTTGGGTQGPGQDQTSAGQSGEKGQIGAITPEEAHDMAAVGLA